MTITGSAETGRRSNSRGRRAESSSTPAELEAVPDDKVEHSSDEHAEDEGDQAEQQDREEDRDEAQTLQASPALRRGKRRRGGRYVRAKLNAHRRDRASGPGAPNSRLRQARPLPSSTVAWRPFREQVHQPRRRCRAPSSQAFSMARAMVALQGNGGVREQLAEEQAVARQARDRPDGARHPSRPRGRAGQAARVSGRRASGGADHRRLPTAGERSIKEASNTTPDALRQERSRNERSVLPMTSRILDTDPERLEVRHNGEWLEMGMAELLKLVRTTTVAQLLEREDFAKRLTTSPAPRRYELMRALHCCKASADSVASRRRRVELGHRSGDKPAAGARHPARLWPGRTGDHDDGDSRRRGRPPEDVQVAGQLDQV